MDTVNENDSSTNESFKNDIFKINPIEFNGSSRLICMQSQNGPCPLIAILNCLLLNGEITLEPNTDYLTGEDMVNRLLNHILEKEKESEELQVILDHFNELQTGLVVNVRFSNVSHFEDCNRLHVFDYLGIKLYHGWLMDSQVTPDYDRLKNYSYDQAAEDLVQDNDLLSTATKRFLQEFIHSNQLTYPGLCQLNETMQEHQLAILFHNNHFSVIYKQGVVYLLSTDIGYSEQPGHVWQLLNSVNGDTEFVNDRFEPVQAGFNDEVVEDSDFELAKKLALDDDYKLAMELQEKENEDIERTQFGVLPPQQPSQQHHSVSNDHHTSHNHRGDPIIPPGKDRGGHDRQKDWSCTLL